MKSGKWVLIYGSQWQGEQNRAEVVSQDELIQAAARTGNLDVIYAEYPELKGSLPDEEMDAPCPESFEAEAVAFGNGAHIIVPKELIGNKIRYSIME